MTKSLEEQIAELKNGVAAQENLHATLGEQLPAGELEVVLECGKALDMEQVVAEILAGSA